MIIKAIDRYMQRMYQKMLNLSGTKNADYALAAIAFAESSVFPFYPDPLFVTMAIKNKKRIWYLAFLCTVSSVLGGYLGYLIGYALYDSIGSLIMGAYGAEENFNKFQHELQTMAFWVIVAKGVTPIPYKIITIVAGFVHVDLMTFTIASIIARGFRFLYMGIALWYFGPQIKEFMDKYVSILVVVMILAIALGFYLIKYF